jgi:hypothetical protein
MSRRPWRVARAAPRRAHAAPREQEEHDGQARAEAAGGGERRVNSSGVQWMHATCNRLTAFCAHKVEHFGGKGQNSPSK